MFGGRSPACSQSCKIVKLPPSGMGIRSAICDCKWRTKQWSHSFKLTPMHAHLDLLMSFRLREILMHKQAGHLSYHSQHQILWTKYKLYLFNCWKSILLFHSHCCTIQRMQEILCWVNISFQNMMQCNRMHVELKTKWLYYKICILYSTKWCKTHKRLAVDTLTAKHYESNEDTLKMLFNAYNIVHGESS